ncbi:hypothetical protein, partial [Escherichia coli]|uniref:hypothetical protein n=1 Tax=Escherichia coli TaxID=562 RepID=UPI001F4821CE
SFPNKTPAISKLELVLDIYPSLSLILRYIYCLVFQGASSLKLNYKGGQTPSAHQERPGCFPGVFRQPLTPIMGSIPTFIPEMNTGFNLLNKK